MSFIGKLEQLNLSLVLQGIETYAKTGLLVIKQEVLGVELYFRDGRLMCIGPVRTNASLGERLLQAGVISTQVLQEAISTIGIAQPGETRIALTLMDLGHVSHEGLRAWATKEADEVIQVLLTWQSGEIYFEEGQQPPTDRLLIALSPTSLLPSTATLTSPRASGASFPATPIQAPSPALQEQQRPDVVAAPPAQMSASQLIPVDEKLSNTVSFAPPASPVPVLNMFGSSASPVPPPLSPPQRVAVPLAPMRIDTSFMRPEMVLLPLDLSALRDRNPQVQITPDQWRILTCVDGRTSLQLICQELAMPANLVCQLAGELIALGLIQVSMPMQQAPMDELPSVSRALITPALGNGYIASTYAASASQPSAVITEELPPFSSSSIPFETRSQWGNGGNGATFVPGHGWIASSQPLQPLQPGGPLYATHNVYVQAGGRSR